jgi:ABC-type spermidine/putrescine transport system permease subunit II
MVLPIVLLGVYSFKPADSYGGVEPGFSIEAWVQLFLDRDLDDTLIFEPVYLQIIWRSIVLATIGTTMSFLIGFPVAWYIAQQSPGTRNILLLLITIPFWTNLLIRVYSWILILGKNGMDETMQEAGRDLYTNDAQVLWYIVLPQLKPGIFAGAFLAFIISVDDFIISLMVAGAGVTTLPLYIYGMIRLGISPEINAVSTVLFLISVTLVGTYWFISKQNEGANYAH